MPPFIHPTAIISPRAELGSNVGVGPYSIVHENVIIGANTTIGSHCEIGIETPRSQSPKLVIGNNSLIRSHSVFYAGSQFGDGLTTGHRVSVRENTKAGHAFQIGTLCDIQGDCEIGDYVRFHSNVHVGQKTKIGSFVFLFPYVVVTNDPHPPSELLMGAILEDFCVIATMSVVLPGVRVASGALVGAMTQVKEDVPAEMICIGSPGKIIGPTSKIKHRGTNKPAYPWRRHFHRGYPDELVQSWLAQLNEMDPPS